VIEPLAASSSRGTQSRLAISGFQGMRMKDAGFAPRARPSGRANVTNDAAPRSRRPAAPDPVPIWARLRAE
jgi:hypothetical protein